MNDFLVLTESYQVALLLRTRVDNLLTYIGLLRNLKKDVWNPTHVGLTIDFRHGDFRAPR
jgi:hypothetical protein